MAGPRKPLYGVGINDADYFTQSDYHPDGTKRRWMCMYYRKWKHMIERVYSEREHQRQPHTIGNSMDSNWHYFMEFRSWLIAQDYDGETFLDKDLLVQGNQHYSPSTCALVPEYLNNLLLTRDRHRGEFPLGVCRRSGPYKFTRPYISQCSVGKGETKIHMGYFDDPMEAHVKWQEQKIIQIELRLQRYSTEKCFRQDVSDSIMTRVDQLRTDIACGLETKYL